MSDEAPKEIEQAQQPPRPAWLTDEDRRLLTALLDELLGKTQEGRPIAQPQGAE